MTKPDAQPEPTAPVLRVDRAGLVNIYETLGTIKGSFDDVTHRWKVAALRRQLKDAVDLIVETRDDVQKLTPKDFYEARENLCRDHSAKNKDGAPIISNQSYLIDPEKKAAFDTALGVLTTEHKPALDAYNTEIDKTNKFLKEEVDAPATTIRLKLSWFNKTATQDMFEVLFDFIDDDLAEVTAAKAASETPKK